MFVPPGIPAGDTGAWGSVQPQEGGGLGTVRAEYHLHNTNWTGKVGVRIPAANLEGAGDTLVTHVRGGGSESYSWGTASVDGPGYATVAVNSLSDFTSDEFECLPNAGAITAILDCSDAPQDELPASIAQRRADQLRSTVAPTLVRGPCNDTDRVHSSGTIPYGMSCSNDAGNGSAATWTLSNDTGASVVGGLFNSTGAVYSIDKKVNAESLSWADSHHYGGLVGLAKKLIFENHGLLMSDSSVTIKRPAGSPPAVVRLDSSQVDGAKAWVALNTISSVQDMIDALGDSAFVIKATEVVRHCVVDVAVVKGLDAIPGCVENGIEGVATKAWDGLDGRTVRARRLKTAIKAGGFIFRWGGLIDNAISSALVSLEANIGAGDLSLWYTRPAPPAGVGGGNLSLNAGGGEDGTIVADNGDRGNVLFKIGSGSRPYFVPPHPGSNGVAHDVMTTNDYYCLAHQYPLRDQLPVEKLLDYATQESIDAETCDAATSTLRYVQGNETNFILRQFAGSDGIAHAWFIDGQSRLHPISNGVTYVCLAQKYYVLDGRNDDEITKFGPEQQPATCP